MSKALHAGYDVRTPSPGEFKSMKCDTCGEEMTVERNVVGATGFAEAMAKKSHKHDRFTCPNAGEMWHNQIIHLLEAVNKTPSATLSAIYQVEINGIRKTKKHTKECY
jgi:predicted RNA-binding Zn-ribbon protein involved in translation (DUF1610 family)